MGSGAMRYIPSFIKIGSDIPELIVGGGGYIETQRIWWAHKSTCVLFFQNKEIRLKIQNAQLVTIQPEDVFIKKKLYSFFFSPMLATCPVHLNHPDCTSFILFGGDCSHGAPSSAYTKWGHSYPSLVLTPFNCTFFLHANVLQSHETRSSHQGH
jgi:hypothetical protein